MSITLTESHTDILYESSTHRNIAEIAIDVHDDGRRTLNHITIRNTERIQDGAHLPTMSANALRKLLNRLHKAGVL